jgi:hypothetical protein
MPAIIQTNQIYRPGEVPVFAAFVFDADNQPIQREQIASITMSHMELRMGLQGGRVVETWFPVEYPGGNLEAVRVTLKAIQNVPIVISGSDLFAFTQNPNEALAQYNFLYIPLRGRNFYPHEGQYRTVFRIEFDNGEMDMMTFLSRAAILVGTYPNEQPILVQNADDVSYGHDVDLDVIIYSKYKENNGTLSLLDTSTLLLSELIDDIYLTVFDTKSSERMIDRLSIRQDTIISPVVIEGKKAFQLRYTFPTHRLPVAAKYKFRFEIEITNPENIVRDSSILCIFDIDVLVE